jgi:hypothetical protein
MSRSPAASAATTSSGIHGRESRIADRRDPGMMNRVPQAHFHGTTHDDDAIDVLSSAAQSRRYVDGTYVDFGDAAGDKGGGDVFDTCGSARGSAPSMVNGGGVDSHHVGTP